MIERLKNIFNKWSCPHEWGKWDSARVCDDFCGWYYVTYFVCKKCGKFKKVKTY